MLYPVITGVFWEGWLRDLTISLILFVGVAIVFGLPAWLLMGQKSVMISEGGIAENTSGDGKFALLPADLRGWNWGAFFWGWLWGARYRSWLTLLLFLPAGLFVLPLFLAGLDVTPPAWMITWLPYEFIAICLFSVYCGIKGNDWAWRNNVWKSVEQFKQIQNQWARWSLMAFLCIVILLLACSLIASVWPLW